MQVRPTLSTSAPAGVALHKGKRMNFWDDVAKFANTDASSFNAPSWVANTDASSFKAPSWVANTDESSFKAPSWVANARQTLGTDVEPVYPMKTVHGGNQEPDTSKAPIGYRYDNGKNQYQYLDLAGTPTNLVNRGNLGEAIKTLAPIGLSMIGANFLAPALNDLFGPATSDLFGGGGSEFGAGAGDFLSGAPQLTPAAIEAGLGTAGYGTNASAIASRLFNPATIGAGAALTVADLLAGTSGAGLISGAGVTPLGDIAATGTNALTPAAIESLAGTAGYGTNASAVNAAINAGINPAIVGAGAGGTIADLLAGTTGAAVTTPAVTSLNEMVASGTAAGFDAAGSGAYLNNLGATIPGVAGAAGTAAAGATPWYQTPTAMLTGASLVGGLAQAASQRQAAAAQSDAAQRALDMQKSIYEQQSALNKPFYQAGVTGQNRLMDLLGLGSNTTGADFGKYGKDFSMSDFQADPGYAFRLAEGQKALDRQAAARGGLISGGAMKAASRYGQDMGSQEYQNAFNRYQTNRANQLQPLGSLMASGQAAANQQSGTLGAYGTNAANLLTQQGTAQAAGNLGTGNTINNMINAGVSAYQNNSLVDQLRRLNPSIYTG